MALRVQYKPLGMKPSVTQPKIPGLGTSTPSLTVPKPVVPKPAPAPMPSAPKVNYAPGGVVAPKIPQGPTLPPPVNEPLDFRRTGVPTPNDRPPPMPQVPPPPVGGLLPGAPTPYDRPGAQRPEVPPPLDVPRRAPTVPRSPNAPPGDPNDPAQGRGTIPPPTTPAPAPVPNPQDPRNPNRENPGDPANGRGTIPPDDKSQTNYRRQHETTKDRIARLEAKLRERGGKDAALEERIAKLRRRKQSGERVPGDPTRDKPRTPPNPTQRVQLDDDPDTWTPEMLAELAPARGTVTQFYDNAKSTDKKATDPVTGKPQKGDSDNDNVADKNEVRQSESWEQRLQRLRKKAAGGSNPQLDKRIAELEKKIKAAGGQVPKDKTSKQAVTAATTKETPKPTSQVPQGDNKGTRANENLNDRLTRLKAKLASATTAEQKAQLKKRIAALEARIKVGDTKGKTNDQPGTPERPYRNRGVSYRPLGYGGQLRI